MIVQFIDTHGRPIFGATVCVIESPQPFPDLGMVTDDAGEIDFDVPIAGYYGFSIHHNGRSQQVALMIRDTDNKVRLLLD